jgi:hypothetical protein
MTGKNQKCFHCNVAAVGWRRQNPATPCRVFRYTYVIVISRTYQNISTYVNFMSTLFVDKQVRGKHATQQAFGRTRTSRPDWEHPTFAFLNHSIRLPGHTGCLQTERCAEALCMISTFYYISTYITCVKRVYFNIFVYQHISTMSTYINIFYWFQHISTVWSMCISTLCISTYFNYVNIYQHISTYIYIFQHSKWRVFQHNYI